MKKVFENLLFAAISAVGSLALVFAPMVLMKGPKTFTFVPQEIELVLLCVVISTVSALLGFRPAIGIKEIKEQRLVVWGFLGFIFWYVACAALCERVSLLPLPPIFRDIGLGFVVVGGLIRISAVAVLGRFHSAFVTLMPEHKIVQKGLYRWVRHPSYLGMLIVLTGMPMVFATWFPLLAMPGAFIVLKWRMDAEEGFLCEHFGEEYESYCRQTWRLIPFIY